MKDILFDEKIAGSFHLTPGQAYEEADNGNRSQIHWDMVCIQRPEFGGGEIWFDGKLIRKDGLFVLPELVNLNPQPATAQNEPARLRRPVYQAGHCGGGDCSAGWADLRGHVTGINGPDYWRWPWRVYRGLTPYLAVLLAAVPLFIAQWWFSAAKGAALPGILLMMATVLAFEIAVRGLDMTPFNLTRLVSITEEPGTTGYFTQAEGLVTSGRSVREYLGEYVCLMPTFPMHACNKPPGATLFYVPFSAGDADGGCGSHVGRAGHRTVGDA